MELIGLIDNLKTHEMERKAREETAPQKKNTIVFKSTPTIFGEDEEEEYDEDLSFLVRNVRRMYNKVKINNSSDGKERRKRKSSVLTVRNPNISLSNVQIYKTSHLPQTSQRRHLRRNL